MTEQVVAYQRMSRDGKVLDLIALDLPPSTFETEAIWFVPEPEQLAGLDGCRSCSARCTRPSTR